MLNDNFFRDSSKRLAYVDLSYRYEYNGVDNWNYPRRGLKIVGTATSRWCIEGMQHQAILGLEFAYFKKIGGRFYGSFVLRGKKYH